MLPEDSFHLQLARTIQAWLWIESEAYVLYAVIMRGANAHLVSVTFHHIQSFEAKLGLLDNCLALILDKDSSDWKDWRNLFNRAGRLNGKRNKIVHEPVITEYQSGEISAAISPSFLNALALAKGQTTHRGSVVLRPYNPSGAKLLEEHKMTLAKLIELEKCFKDFSRELRGFKDKVAALMKGGK